MQFYFPLLQLAPQTFVLHLVPARLGQLCIFHNATLLAYHLGTSQVLLEGLAHLTCRIRCGDPLAPDRGQMHACKLNKCGARLFLTPSISRLLPALPLNPFRSTRNIS